MKMYLKTNKTQLYKLFQCYYPDIPIFAGHELPLMKYCTFKKFFRWRHWELGFRFLAEDCGDDISASISIYTCLGVPCLQVSVRDGYGNPIFSEHYDLELDELVKRGMVEYREESSYE